MLEIKIWNPFRKEKKINTTAGVMTFFLKWWELQKAILNSFVD